MDPVLPVYLLAPLFFLTAFFYAMAGFAGGSTYTALLALSGVNYSLVPVISLTCNSLVSGLSVVRFLRNGHWLGRLTLPLLAASVPMAFIGGRLPVSETIFFLVLGAALFFAGGYISLLSGGFMAQLASILDGCDGEIARLKCLESPFGA